MPSDFATTITHLHNHTGLTWQQLARLFGVNQRTLHAWTTGTTVPAHHQQIAAMLTEATAHLGDTPTKVHAALFAPTTGASNVYTDLIRNINRARQPDINTSIRVW